MKLRTLAAGAAALALASASNAAAADHVTFHSPSGNIHCLLDHFQGWAARCDIYHYTYRPPHMPSTCEGDWGDAWRMGRTGRARFICHGDTVEPGRVLKYGRKITFGPFTCTSRTSGLTCRNASKHGWTVSRAAYRLF